MVMGFVNTVPWLPVEEQVFFPPVSVPGQAEQGVVQRNSVEILKKQPVDLLKRLNVAAVKIH